MTLFKHLRWALLWALVILGLCAIPGRDLPQWSWADLLSIDKLVHASIFAILVILLVHGLRRSRPLLSLHSRAVWTALALCVAYGGALEIMQGTLLSDRSADVLDFLANSFGCGLGWWWLRRKEREAATPAG